MYSQVSMEYQTKILGDSRTFRAVIKENGEPIDIDIVSIKTKRASSEGEDISMSKSFPQYMELRGYTDSDLKGKEITMELGLKLEDGTYEYIPMNKVTVNNVNVENGVKIIEAYDRLYMEGGKELDRSQFTQESENFITAAQNIAAQLGTTFAPGTINRSTTFKPSFPDGCTVAEAAGYMAGYISANAYIGRTGQLEFKQTADIAVHYPESAANMIGAIIYDTYERKIEKLYVTNENTVIMASKETVNSPAVEIYNPLVLAQGKADSILNDISKYNMENGYSACVTDNAMADPRIDPWDMISFVDGTRNVNVLCGMIELDYDGGLTMSMSSYAKDEADESAANAGSVGKQLEDLNNKIESSNGLYKTEETLEDGSKIYYLHDKINMSDSLQVWKFQANAISLSTDGGETYPYGLTIDGTLIQKYIETVELLADQIKTGVLKLNDDDSAVLIGGEDKSTCVAYFSKTEAYVEKLDAYEVSCGDGDLDGLPSTNLKINGDYADALNMGLSKRVLLASNPRYESLKNLNNIKTPGVYIAASSSVASQLTNCPISTMGFRMEVKLLGQSTRGQQTIYPNTNGNMYYRRWSGSTFTSWYKIEGTAV